MGLQTFDDVNEKLRALVESQSSNISGCQIGFMPTEGSASYICQIAFRDRQDHGKACRQFLRAAFREIRAGGRFVVIRAYSVSTETDFEAKDLITRGYGRLVALEVAGDLLRHDQIPERVDGGYRFN